ncbi:hypothetical protein GX563_05970 [Candidatus Bathyarchaeota archaeon]|nr:hypothetical protein [Candidatus Bathyarchaeota archaeon]
MKKTLTCLLILLVTSSIALTFAPNTSGSTADVAILDNYTFYEDSLGYLVVIGEVQNVGSSVIANVSLTGSITTDTTTASGGCIVWGYYLLPGQKAPFYMEFYQQNSGASWAGLTKSDISLSVYTAPETSQYKYQEVVVVSSAASPTATGEYWVTAELKNTGTQTAKGIAVVATFYNSEGLPVGSGYINPVSTLAAGATTTVKVPCWDLNQTIVDSSHKIASYRLLIQVESPIQTDGNIPVVSSNPTPVPGQTSTSTSSGSQATGTDQTALYAAIVAAIAVVTVVAVLLIKRRKTGGAGNGEFKPAERSKKTRRERKNA